MAKASKQLSPRRSKAIRSEGQSLLPRWDHSNSPAPGQGRRRDEKNQRYSYITSVSGLERFGRGAERYARVGEFGKLASPGGDAYSERHSLDRLSRNHSKRIGFDTGRQDPSRSQEHQGAGRKRSRH